MEAATGFEPVIRALQARALPLGYAALALQGSPTKRNRRSHLAVHNQPEGMKYRAPAIKSMKAQKEASPS